MRSVPTCHVQCTVQKKEQPAAEKIYFGNPEREVVVVVVVVEKTRENKGINMTFSEVLQKICPGSRVL
jgi:hypothetical protein